MFLLPTAEPGWPRILIQLICSVYLDFVWCSHFGLVGCHVMTVDCQEKYSGGRNRWRAPAAPVDCGSKKSHRIKNEIKR